MTVFTAENDCGCARLGVSVGKSCGGAAVRNRVKRLLREAFRQSQDTIPGGFDYVVMVSPALGKELRESTARGLRRRLALEEVKASLLGLITSAVEKAHERRAEGLERPEEMRGK